MDHKIKALIVEDNAIACMAAKGNLEKPGCNVDIANTGQKAIELCENFTYNIIFMDIGLGDTDGFAVTQEIKSKCQINKETPVVALTAHSEDEYKKKAEKVGMMDFLNKPIDTLQVEKILKELFNV